MLKKADVNKNQQGVVLIHTLLILSFLFGVGALVVDLGGAMVFKQMLENRSQVSIAAVGHAKLMQRTGTNSDTLQQLIIANLNGQADNLTFNSVSVQADEIFLDVSLERRNRLAQVSLAERVITFRSVHGLDMPRANIAFVMDLSGSMENGIGTESRMDLAGQMVTESTARVRNSLDRVAIVTHNENVRTPVTFNPPGGFSTSDVALTTSSIVTGDRTALGAGLHTAFAQQIALPTAADEQSAIILIGDGQVGDMNPLNLDPGSALGLAPNTFATTGTHYYRLFSDGHCRQHENPHVSTTPPPLGTPLRFALDIQPVEELSEGLGPWDAPPFQAACGSYGLDLSSAAVSETRDTGRLASCTQTNAGVCSLDRTQECLSAFAGLPDSTPHKCLASIKIVHPDTFTPGPNIAAWSLAEGSEKAQGVQTILEADFARKRGISVHSVVFSDEAQDLAFSNRLALVSAEEAGGAVVDKWWLEAGRVPPLAVQRSGTDKNVTGISQQIIDATLSARGLNIILWKIQTKWK